MRFFPDSCPKNTVRGEVFEVEEQSKITQHSNFYRCTKRTAGGAHSNGGISVSKQKVSHSEGISMYWKYLRCWFHSIRPGGSWFCLVEEHLNN
jgi:hypothetical protein